MTRNLGGEFTHDCISYLKQKLEWSKKKAQLDREAYKYSDDLLKVFCGGLDERKQVQHIPIPESIDVEEAIIGSLMQGIANLSVVGKFVGKSVVSHQLQKQVEEIQTTSMSQVMAGQPQILIRPKKESEPVLPEPVIALSRPGMIQAPPLVVIQAPPLI